MSQVNGAFEAFASSLLRLKGRVRFSTISRVFREEFPSFASEDILPNVTLGRSIQAWYETKTGKPLKKSRSGSYIGMSLINPHYTESDLTPLRTVQALYDKEMDKSFAKLGLNVVRSSAKSGGQAVKAKQERREGKARKGSTPKGKDVGMNAGKLKRSAAPQDDRKEVKEILTYCVEAFANCRLTDQGNVTFRELYSEFVKNFPFAEKESSFSVSSPAMPSRVTLPPAGTTLRSDAGEVVQGEQALQEEKGRALWEEGRAKIDKEEG